MLACVAGSSLSRDDLEKFLSSSRFTEVAVGSFVRVLLEGEADRRKYGLARIEGISSTGSPYIFGSCKLTTNYLQLQFGTNNATYQINTVSNSPPQKEDIDEWIEAMRSDESQTMPTVSDLKKKAIEISVLRREILQLQNTSAVPSIARAAISTAAQQLVSQQNSHPIVDVDVVEDSSCVDMEEEEDDQEQNPPKRHSTSSAKKRAHQAKQQKKDEKLHLLLEQKEDLLKTKDLRISSLERQLEMVPFPPNLENLALAQLYLVESQIEEYRTKVRSLIAEKKRCIVCMENECCVIFYPCKHKIACDICSKSLSVCPVCRSAIKDRIKPYGN